MAVLAMDVRDICHYELLIDNETISAASYLDFFKGPMDS